MRCVAEPGAVAGSPARASRVGCRMRSGEISKHQRDFLIRSLPLPVLKQTVLLQNKRELMIHPQLPMVTAP
jgi:hypothetical protein